jgi:glycosyltransferase involved in cell wall biosynthesis
VSTDVSVIIPCRNERSTIEQVLADLHAQTYPGTIEVVVADGCSDDGTRQILDAAARNNDYRFALHVITNERRVIPSALNRAVEHACGRVIVRVDGHSRVPSNYVEEIVSALSDSKANVVGPRVRFVPGSASSVAFAIATLQASVFGTGGTASRRSIARPVRVSHAVMSCYTRSVWERVDGYDEGLLTNEDFDFDYRAARSGETVLALPSPEFQLMARSTLSGLIAQRWRYGWWKAAVIKKHPRSLHLRQVIPVIALLALVVLAGMSFVSTGYAMGLIAMIYGYVGLSSCASLLALMPHVLSEEVPDGRRVLVTVLLAPVIFAIIHGIWAAGVVAGLFFARRATQ